ncbi:hypothetical protein FE782_07935 [Paenibacillus antri]|uniref:Uncharacterized protein n=1 Tax=Paenibacillus antri TaxID=2582848 RepID=A0A5R9GGQ5_9BACL|nr:hypothetical protein [Paenibacillus antri]TLS52558.1 hypothetical protein FE782_07935 [Paenibacillus antri]
MGVKFNREYKDIVTDLANAIGTIDDSYEAFEMDADDWSALASAEQAEFMRTLADDIFYGLGSMPKLSIGSGTIEYDPANHVLKVHSHENVVHVIQLI